jgi:hypothetical protein
MHSHKSQITWRIFIVKKILSYLTQHTDDLILAHFLADENPPNYNWAISKGAPGKRTWRPRASLLPLFALRAPDFLPKN